mgnify:CR=1 FL=1
MTPILFSMGASSGLAERLAQACALELGELIQRPFPDQESYLRLMTAVAGCDVAFFSPLDRPDAKTLPLLLLAAAAREQGARSVGLVAPYLGYMRQDRAFNPGEAVTSVSYAALLSRAFDWLVTVDPHLHRHASLDAIYTIPSAVASAAQPVADWVRREVDNPILIGPDEESAQWVEHIASLAGARSTVLRKTRRGDYDVSIDGAPLQQNSGATPVIVDDIVSSGRTMIEAARLVRHAGWRPPICIAVHALFAGDAYQALQSAGAARIISTNTITHPSNTIDVSRPLADAVAQFVGEARGPSELIGVTPELRPRKRRSQS